MEMKREKRKQNLTLQIKMGPCTEETQGLSMMSLPAL